jgi:ADP-ribose pyrophosphatase YjhB (NUDIX family)
VAVVVRDQRGWLLLEKRSDCGLWGLAGGRIEPGESVSDAAVREIKEETGLVVEITRLIGVYSDADEGRIITYPDGVVHSIDILLEARLVGGTLTPSAESEALQFFEPSALPPDCVPSSRMPLADAVGAAVGSVR